MQRKTKEFNKSSNSLETNSSYMFSLRLCKKVPQRTLSSQSVSLAVIQKSTALLPSQRLNIV